MAIVRPFRAVRPTPALADKVAALPYDVMNSQEARDYVKDNPYSFMRIDRAEINLPEGVDMYSQQVYETAATRLNDMKKEGVYIQDAAPCYYIYKQVMDGRAQVGIVACASVDDYMNNVVKKHELTLAKKEDDRCNHVDFCNANTGPIFLTYRANDAINAVVERNMQKAPVYDFVGDGVQQTCWIIDKAEDIEVIQSSFAAIPALYIADGHHRCASAVRVARKRRVQNPDFTGEEEFNFFLCVLFPDEQLAIMDYNRVVADLNGNSEAEFLAKVSEKFDVEQLGTDAPHVTEKHTFGMFLSGQWWKLTAKAGTFDADDVVAQLDVSILQENLLTPVLGIGDPRTDKRIDFIGGIRGLKELERRVNEGMAVAFAMCPTSIEDLMSIANSGRIMPPKSTWFEPKLLSGLFIHELR